MKTKINKTQIGSNKVIKSKNQSNLLAQVRESALQEEKDRQKYDGWTNRSTWAVRLHWDNNQGDQEYFSEQAKEFKESGKEVYEFEDFLKENYEEMYDSVVDGEGTEAGKNMAKDVGNGVDVNWREIAQAYYGDVE